MKFKFKSDGGDKRKTFKFVGASAASISQRSEVKKLRNDLAACLVDMTNEWKEFGTEISEAKGDVIACIEQVQSESGKPEEWQRMKLNLEQIEELPELVKYIYNFMLRAQGLSVNRVIGGRRS